MGEKYGFVYIWRDKGKDRWYVGCYWGSEDDGYVCSSNWMRMSHKRRPQDFRRRILSKIFTSKDDMFLEEEKWLQLIKKKELGNKYYNLRNQRYGVKDMPGENNPMYGVSLVPCNKGKSGYKVKPCSEERKRKISIANSHPLSEEHRQKLSIAKLGKSTSRKGNHLSEAHKQSLKDAWVKRKATVL